LTDLKSKEVPLGKEVLKTDFSSDNPLRSYSDLISTDPVKNVLIYSLQDLLSYFLTLLRNEQPILPKATAEVWSARLNYLNNYAIIPLLYWKIGLLPPELRPPKDIVNQMRETFLGSHGRYLLMEGQLREIIRAFEHEGIEALVLKGPALAVQVYPHPATRPFADIDLLVRPDQYSKTKEALCQLGYRSQTNRFDTFQELFNADSFVHSDNSKKYFEVDVHWSLFQYHGLARNNGVEEVLWNTQKVETPTLRFETLDRVNALLYAAFHLIIQHPDDMRLTWIGDISLLAQSLVYPDEWELLRQRCSTLKLSLAMEEALKLAQVLYGLQLPEVYSDFTKWLDPEEDEKAELTYLSQKGGPDIRLKGYFGNFLSAPR
jgi:hypothetical protein